MPLVFHGNYKVLHAAADGYSIRVYPDDPLLCADRDCTCIATTRTAPSSEMRCVRESGTIRKSI